MVKGDFVFLPNRTRLPSAILWHNIILPSIGEQELLPSSIRMSRSFDLWDGMVRFFMYK